MVWPVRGRGRRKVKRSVLFLFVSPPHMTDSPLNSNGTNCVAVGKGGGGGVPLVLPPSQRIWFGCLSQRQQSCGGSCLSPPAFIFPSSMSHGGWREAGGTQLPPPPALQAITDLLGLEQEALQPSLWSFLLHSFEKVFSNLQHLLGLFFTAFWIFVFCCSFFSSNPAIMAYMWDWLGQQQSS